MTTNPNILIIDDEEKFRQLLTRIISLEGFNVLQAGNISQGLKIIQQEKNIDIVLTDVKLPDGNSIDILEKIKTINPICEIIVMTAFGTIHDGVKAIKLGAFDYFTKGDDNDQIIPALNRAADKVKLQKRIFELETKLETKYGFDIIIGHSEAIKNTISLLLHLFLQPINHNIWQKKLPWVATANSMFPIIPLYPLLKAMELARIYGKPV